MEGLTFIRRVFGNWVVILIAVIYELCILDEVLTKGETEFFYGGIHMIGILIMAFLFKFTKDDNEVANKYGYYHSPCYS